jgi:hypothetical protein
MLNTHFRRAVSNPSGEKLLNLLDLHDFENLSATMPNALTILDQVLYAVIFVVLGVVRPISVLAELNVDSVNGGHPDWLTWTNGGPYRMCVPVGRYPGFLREASGRTRRKIPFRRGRK